MSEELLRRVARLERENRRLRWAGAVGFLLLGLFVLGAATPARGILEGRALHLRDRNGKLRLKLSAAKSVPFVMFLDEKERIQALYCPRGEGRYSADGRLRYTSGEPDCLPAEAE